MTTNTILKLLLLDDNHLAPYQIIHILTTKMAIITTAWRRLLSIGHAYGYNFKRVLTMGKNNYCQRFMFHFIIIMRADYVELKINIPDPLDCNARKKKVCAIENIIFERRVYVCVFCIFLFFALRTHSLPFFFNSLPFDLVRLCNSKLSPLSLSLFFVVSFLINLI